MPVLRREARVLDVLVRPVRVQQVGMTELQQRTFLSHVKATPDCWVWTAALSTSGYGWAYSPAIGKSEGAHRISYRHFVGQISKGVSVLHTCDNRRCVNPSHLFLGTQQDNIADMMNKGRSSHPVGVAHHRAKLTDAAVTAIRACDTPSLKLAKHYNVSPGTIRRARYKHAWKHLP